MSNIGKADIDSLVVLFKEWTGNEFARNVAELEELQNALIDDYGKAGVQLSKNSTITTMFIAFCGGVNIEKNKNKVEAVG